MPKAQKVFSISTRKTCARIIYYKNSLQTETFNIQRMSSIYLVLFAARYRIFYLFVTPVRNNLKLMTTFWYDLWLNIDLLCNYVLYSFRCVIRIQIRVFISTNLICRSINFIWLQGSGKVYINRDSRTNSRLHAIKKFENIIWHHNKIFNYWFLKIIFQTGIS